MADDPRDIRPRDIRRLRQQLRVAKAVDTHGAPLRVVIIDDFAPMRSLVRIVLDLAGVAVVVAEADGSPEEVIAACNRDPDAVLLDQHLGSTRGTDLIGEISRRCPTAMIAMFSALDPADEEEPAMTAGAFTFYEKKLLATALPDVLVQDHALFQRALAGEDVCAPSATDRRRSLNRGGRPQDHTQRGCSAGPA